MTRTGNLCLTLKPEETLEFRLGGELVRIVIVERRIDSRDVSVVVKAPESVHITRRQRDGSPYERRPAPGRRGPLSRSIRTGG